MKSPILFIGYEPSMHDEIREFLKERQGVAHFSGTKEETISLLNLGLFSTVVLKMQCLEDAVMLRYINLNYQKTRVLVMPGTKMQYAIPALSSGKYEILQDPLKLEELKSLFGK